MSSPFFLPSSIEHGGLPERREEVLEEALGSHVRGESELTGALTPRISPARFRLAGWVLILSLVGLTARAAHLQIIEGATYRAKAEGNRVRTLTVVPTRGLLFDRFGTVLAKNTPMFVLTMTIADLPRDAVERETVLKKVTDLSGIQRADVDLLISTYAKTPFDPVPVKKELPYETAMRLAIETASLPGFRLETGSIRSYPVATSSLSHLLGYVGTINPEELSVGSGAGSYRPIDVIGKTGVEKTGETLLRGLPGKTTFEVDARGKELSVLSHEEPGGGAHLTLTLDTPLQQFIEERLSAVLRATGTRRGSVVALDPRDGSVRALVSLPAYDNNAFARGIEASLYQRLLDDPNHPLFPRAVAGEFPSGSTFKPFVAYAALKEGLIGEHSTFLSTGGIPVGPWFFPDWKTGGHGYTDVRKALAESVNTFFYMIGGGYNDFTGLGVEKMTAYAREFGFGEKTGIDLSGEADGFLPSKEWKEETKGERWYVGDTYHLAIGQGDLLVTPIQMAAATSILANRGTVVRPHLIEAINGEPAPLETKTGDFSAEALSIVRQGMRQAVTQGSARGLLGLPEAVAGKTGTAQTPGDRPTHAWFTGFGPYQDPNLVLVVLIEEGGEGSAVAVPLANEIFYWWFTNRKDE
jgi:penicillin-binding protein 2